MAFKFEDLKVWQKALDLSGMVHDVAIKFPKEEMFVLAPQIKRAADSISLNMKGQQDKQIPNSEDFWDMLYVRRLK